MTDFDFVVKAKKVIIKEKGNHKYQVNLAGIGNFLKYQTWSSTNVNNQNSHRSVSLVSAKKWVRNNFPSSNNFTPTTIMEVGNTKYIFVIENATYNNDKKYNTNFLVSIKPIIKNCVSKPLVKLPINKILHNVRFDIDAATTAVVALPDNSGVSNNTNYSNQNYSNLSFNSITFNSCNFTSTIFTSSNFYSNTFNDCTFTSAIFDNTNQSTTFNNNNYNTFSSCTFSNTSYQNANLTGTSLTSANLTSVNFTKTNLTNVNLTGATITGVNFESTTLTGVISQNLIFSTSTQPYNFPENWTLVDINNKNGNIGYCLLGPGANLSNWPSSLINIGSGNLGLVPNSSFQVTPNNFTLPVPLPGVINYSAGPMYPFVNVSGISTQSLNNTTTPSFYSYCFVPPSNGNGLPYFAATVTNQLIPGNENNDNDLTTPLIVYSLNDETNFNNTLSYSYPNFPQPQTIVIVPNLNSPIYYQILSPFSSNITNNFNIPSTSLPETTIASLNYAILSTFAVNLENDLSGVCGIQ